MTSPKKTAPPRSKLVLASASGVWAIRSASSTVYYLDLDCALLMRVPGEGSSTGPGDRTWRRLHGVECVPVGGRGVVRVGARHRYEIEESWWIQRTVTAIEQVTPEDLPQEAGNQSDAQFTYEVATATEARDLAAQLAQAGGDPNDATAQLPDGSVRLLLDLAGGDGGGDNPL